MLLPAEILQVLRPELHRLEGRAGGRQLQLRGPRTDPRAYAHLQAARQKRGGSFGRRHQPLAPRTEQQKRLCNGIIKDSSNKIK